MLEFKSPEMKIAVDSLGKTKIIDFEKELSIDINNLNKELVEQSSKYAWYGSLLSNARYEYEAEKANLAKVEALVDHRIREDIEYNGKKKPTEAAMTRYIHGDDKYVEVLMNIARDKKKVDTLSYVLKGFEQRINALVTLGANVRNEMKQIGVDKINE